MQGHVIVGDKSKHKSPLGSKSYYPSLLIKADYNLLRYWKRIPHIIQEYAIRFDSWILNLPIELFT